MKKSIQWIWVFTSALIIYTSSAHGVSSTEVSREKLLTLWSGEWVSRGLYVATKLELADHLLSGPKSVDELSILTHSEVDSLQRLLHMLAGFGIFEEVSTGVFSNTDASRMLAKSQPDSLYSLSVWYGEDIHRAWDNLLPSVQDGKPAFDFTYGQPVFSYLKENPDRFILFQEAMKEKSRGVIQSALSNYDFGKLNSVYDIGGGYGQFMQALLRIYPHLNGLLFDLPLVIESVRKQAPHLESGNCKLVAGDFFKTVPTGGDAYLLKSVLHDWDDEKCEQILKNCYDAMETHSRLLIVEVVLQPKDRSTYANCMDLLMMAITGGKERSLAAFAQMLDRSGFVLEHVYPTATEFSILEATKK